MPASPAIPDKTHPIATLRVPLPMPSIGWRRAGSATANCVALLTLLSSLSGCGGGSGPAVEARNQSLNWAASATSVDLNASTTVSAQASSGLPVRYASATPAVCTVDAVTGQVQPQRMGTCTVLADQSGNSTFAPASTLSLSISVSVNPQQSLSFGAAPTLSLGDSATVRATASSGLAVSYSSLSPSVCTVDAHSGLVTSLTAGTCTIAADQAGDSVYLPAPQRSLSISVAVPSGMTVPDAPSGVTATAGSTSSSVLVSATSVGSGGSAITRYTVVSVPAGLSAQGSTLPLTVACGSSCSGYAFRLYATNAVGDGSPSAPADVVTRYAVTATFYEPDTQPSNTVFTGSFSYNATTRTVSGLQGTLTESMTGTATGASPYYDMALVPLTYQLSSVADSGLGGLLVTTFRNANTNTFTTAYGGDGWSPEAGVNVGGLYYGYPTRSSGIANPGNAYARIFVNTEDPTATPTPAQLNKLAYADCVPTAAGGMRYGGGMMGATCMTGTSVAGYGAVGTMSGYPDASNPGTQVITRLP